MGLKKWKKGKNKPHRRPQPIILKEPETEEEIRSRIAQLEHARIQLPHLRKGRRSQVFNMQIIIREEALTNEINRFYKKLEEMKDEREMS